MITTLFLILLIAFQLWYVTSDKVKHTHQPAYLRSTLQHKRVYRMIGVVLMLLATILFIKRLGWMSGICASIVGLMGIGCLVVLLNPFRYINQRLVALFYAVFLILEIFI